MYTGIQSKCRTPVRKLHEPTTPPEGMSDCASAERENSEESPRTRAVQRDRRRMMRIVGDGVLFENTPALNKLDSRHRMQPCLHFSSHGRVQRSRSSHSHQWRE